MKRESGASLPVWVEGVEMPATSPLTENLTCDVCVVGAGLAGITTAYLLAKEGKKVVVVEAKKIGSGETGRTTAHLSNALDDGFPELIRLFGIDGTRLAVQSHGQAIDKIEQIAKDENIDCNFTRVDGYMFANNREQEEQLVKELDALQQIGWRDVVLRKECPVPTLTALPCLQFPNQGHFHVLKYLSGVSQSILDNEGLIFTETKVRQFKSGTVATVTTESGFTISANHLVIASNTPVNDVVTMHTKQAPYRTYAIGVSVPAGSVPDALYWNMEDPYHYVRLLNPDGGSKDGDEDKDAADRRDAKEDRENDTDKAKDVLPSGTNLLIVGGADHKTGQSDNHENSFHALENWTRNRFPQAQEVLYRWSGQVYEPVDALAFIGRNPGDTDNVYIITGDSGHGMTHSTIGGMLITDLIMGRSNPWEKLYDPARTSLKSVGEFIKENLNVAAQFKDYVTPGEVEEAELVMPGTGKIMRKGLSKVAVYCDPDGVRHECSAVCTHMGCIVNWNDVESSWDCPCHGSRFDPYGRVVTGPAVKDLGPAS